MVLNFSEAAHFQVSSRQNIAIGGGSGGVGIIAVKCLVLPRRRIPQTPFVPFFAAAKTLPAVRKATSL